MIETYLIGSIDQSLERIRQLRQIVQGPYRREYDGLRQINLTHLDAAKVDLRRLDQETALYSTLFLSTDQTKPCTTGTIFLPDQG